MTEAEAMSRLEMVWRDWGTQCPMSGGNQISGGTQRPMSGGNQISGGTQRPMSGGNQISGGYAVPDVRWEPDFGGILRDKTT